MFEHLPEGSAPLGEHDGLGDQGAPVGVPAGVFEEHRGEVPQGPLGALELLGLCRMVDVHVRAGGPDPVPRGLLQGLG